MLWLKTLSCTWFIISDWKCACIGRWILEKCLLWSIFLSCEIRQVKRRKRGGRELIVARERKPWHKKLLELPSLSAWKHIFLHLVVQTAAQNPCRPKKNILLHCFICNNFLVFKNIFFEKLMGQKDVSAYHTYLMLDILLINQAKFT